MQIDLTQRIERIGRMERHYDALSDAVMRKGWTESEQEKLQELRQYYESGEWLSDYEADEQGLLPSDRKRGVLSQDAIYDLLADIDVMKA